MAPYSNAMINVAPDQAEQGVTCGLKSLIDMKTKVLDNFLPKTKHYFIGMCRVESEYSAEY